MKYKVALIPSEEGFAISAPDLPGCWSQEATESEALANIKAAIREYLAVVNDLLGEVEIREIDVAVQVPKLPGVNHRNAVRALERVGFRITRDGSHIVVTDGKRILTIPRANPADAFTMGGIVGDAVLTIEEFKALL